MKVGVEKLARNEGVYGVKMERAMGFIPRASTTIGSVRQLSWKETASHAVAGMWIDPDVWKLAVHGATL